MFNFTKTIIDTPTLNIESLVIKLSKSSLTLAVSCIYRAPSTDFGSDSKLFDIISDLVNDYTDLLIFGDFNMNDLRSSLTTLVPSNPFYQLLLDLLNDSHLCQLVSKPARPALYFFLFTSPIGKSDHVTIVATYKSD